MTQGSLFAVPDVADSLIVAKRMVQLGLDRGIECPCCGQFAKLYRRQINSSMARTLIALARYATGHSGAPDPQPVHLFRFLRNHGIQHSDAPSLRHWRLIEEAHRPKADGNPRGGHYLITQAGLAFVRGDVEALRYAFIFNDEVIGFSEETTTIRRSLGTRFNYDELLWG